MIEYCRTDTHFLLPLKDRLLFGLRMQPNAEELLASLMADGNSYCLRLYEKKILPSSFMQDTNFRLGGPQPPPHSPLIITDISHLFRNVRTCRAGVLELKSRGVILSDEQVARVYNRGMCGSGGPH
jgi:hypothetical protein